MHPPTGLAARFGTAIALLLMSACFDAHAQTYSPLAEWHYKTAHKDSFVDTSHAQSVLGWQPRLSNKDALVETYDWYLANRERVGGAGVTHRVPWNQQALGLLKRLS